ncbi:DUF2971 domain-containing protein [Alteromonas sp. a30]|uniref:DUF2971 domain-containing protein n=1 Tax=Alteromonas sp. a30 TaxID=2730917 RepID=UPI00227E6EE9|nr:DUF2971 domain-containing protein [Alteromonas sp. a30]MCY7297411.1 DUF2971 domain-containing protein [Alteromonas sp. a30]
MDFLKQSARSLGIKHLYKYRAFDPSNTQFVETIFKKNELYFPSPSGLNDPFECQFRLSVGDLNDLEYQSRHRHWAYGTQKHLPPVKTAEEFFKHYSTFTQKEHAEIAQYTRDECYIRFNSKWGIFSLSSEPENVLMWAHYANNHRGFCLEFDTSNDYFGRAWKVEYVDKIKERDIVDFNESDAFKILLTKTNDWRYESEYRVLANWKDDVPGLPILSEQRVSNFPVDALSSVIFGVRMSDDDITIVRGWLGEEHKNIKLKKVHLDKDGSLFIEEI